MKSIKSILLAALTSIIGISTPVSADDTEIYLNPNSDSGQPLIMLVLEYEPNLSSPNECNGYREKDGRIPDIDSTCGEVFFEAVCGPFDKEIDDLSAIENNCRERISDADEDELSRAIFLPEDESAPTFFELLRAALFVVLDPLEGFRIGLMMYHDDVETRANFDASKNTVQQGICANKVNGKCSNGAYVVLGFNGDSGDDQYPYDRLANAALLDYTGDGTYNLEDHKIRLQEILWKIPTPVSPRTHPHQSKELNFEFFRYLTGQDVFNGHNGYYDYYSADDDKNLDEEEDQQAYAWDKLIERNEGTTYRSPLYEECTRIFVVNLHFTPSTQQDNNSDSVIAGTTGTDLDAQGLPGIDFAGNNNTIENLVFWLNKNATPFSNYDKGDILPNLADRDIADGTHGDAPDLEGNQNVIQYWMVEPPKVVAYADRAQASDYPDGRPISIGGGDIKGKFENIFNEILDISTTFVSATVPVNVYNRSESLDNVFFGIFQPELTRQWNGNVKRLQLHVIQEDDVVAGNPNDYRSDDPLTLDVNESDVGKLAVWDANGIEAITRPLGDDPGGRIKTNALTFWTISSGHDVQAFDTTRGESAGTDGRSVSRGGAGQKIHDFLNKDVSLSNGPRSLYTEETTLAPDLLALNADDPNVAQNIFDDVKESLGLESVTDYADLTNDVPDPPVDGDGNDINNNGIGDQDDVLHLIRFMRGLNPDGTMRPWLLGDILHVQPIPVNYGFTGNGYDEPVAPDSQGNPHLYLLTAGNDGYVRLIRNSTNSVDEDLRHLNAGDEIWAFMPREVLPIQQALFTNTKGTHPYAVDGQLSVYIYDHNDDDVIDNYLQDKVWAYFGMRRGGQGYELNGSTIGKVYYGLDITNPGAAPKLLWKIEKQPDPGDDFYELGQTWSRPTVRFLDWTKDNTSNPKPVLIFGGGYDTDKDKDSNIVSDGYDVDPAKDPAAILNADYEDSEGNSIFIVDAETGKLVWKAARDCSGFDSKPDDPDAGVCIDHSGLKDSIPSNVAAIDAVPDDDGITDRIYVGDTGGAVWRVDLDGDDRANWTINQILSVGRHSQDPDQQPDLRFFHRPDVVPSSDERGSYAAVLIGSGNRADPKMAEYTDRFFMVKDRYQVADGGTPTTKTIGTMKNITTDDTKSDESGDCTAKDENGDEQPIDCQTLNGWYLDLIINSGEKVLSSSLTFENEVFFSSYVPNVGLSGACGPSEGLSYTYAIKLETGDPVFGDIYTSNSNRANLTGAGIASDPVIISLDGSIFISPGNLAQGPTREKISDVPNEQIFWYEENL